MREALASMIALITLLTMAVILVPSWLVIQLNQALEVSDAFATQAAKMNTKRGPAQRQRKNLWNPTREELLGTLDHGSPVSNVALVEKANQAITSGGASVRLWNIDTPELSREWRIESTAGSDYRN